jgi:hypothetical protein
MKHRIWTLLLILGQVLAGCNPGELELPLLAPQIVINANLKAHEPPVVYVGRTWRPNEPRPASTYYAGARVELWEGQSRIGAMRLTGEEYTLPEYLLIPEKEYIVKVWVEGVGYAESKPTGIPPDPVASDFEIRLLTDPIRKGSTVVERPAELSFSLMSNSLLPDSYFVVNVRGVAFTPENEDTQGSVWLIHDEVSEDISLSDKECYDNFYRFGTLAIGYKSSCFPEKEKRIKLYADRWVQLRDKNNRIETRSAIKLQLFITNHPAEYIRWQKSSRIPRENDVYPFDAQPTYSNIIGGTGFVYATNTRNVKEFMLDSLGK